ncbi:hypothetical protein [Natronobacterium gregoryi]|uniref:Uncharacterized protein n=2 Tax=Natronobacterium gregoryi TaxID=44930 RepID=L0AL57_NATGS|nr:hypothetical protein [Natronobacterium gregoryi]AFZ74536.1 hypothetical protein Natgr_3417 [Natronobacterium gregoryi SP2]ELY72391.1 hypothetical protein C490_03568 [Natronobacterium gregoryi SP2]PLK21719.1 hypothetical protein CYV19_02465 [Natronobacterium gregoryi SP2]SFI97062.1 hypothetical protein SAMN05443661_110170 [Natronobacterium gregoryi]
MSGEASSKEIYESVVGYVEKNTGGVQPPLIHEAPVVCSISWSYRDEHPSRVRSAIAAATSRNDLFRYVDESGEHERRYLGIDNADALEEKIEEYHSRSQRTTRNGAMCLRIANQRVDDLRGDDS